MSKLCLLADYDPGTLTSFYLVLLAAVVIAFSLLAGGVARLVGLRESSNRFQKIAAAAFLVTAGIVIFILAFAKELGAL